VAEKERIDRAVADWQRRQEADSAQHSEETHRKELEAELASKTAREEALRRALLSQQVRNHPPPPACVYMRGLLAHARVRHLHVRRSQAELRSHIQDTVGDAGEQTLQQQEVHDLELQV
jgi:hypothetical protein